MAKKKKKKKSRMPYGLTISRSDTKYTFKWSKGETYKDGQQVAYSLNSGKYKPLKVSATATTVNTGSAVKAADYFPTAGKTQKLTKVKFRVRGNANSGSGKKKDYDTWSNWAYKEIKLSPPAAPAITFELDETLSNKGTFSWSLDTSSSSLTPFTDTVYQTAFGLTAEGPQWAAEVTGQSASGSLTNEETYTSGSSYSRWFRIRSRGMAGESDFSEAQHIYALPARCDVSDALVEVSDGGYRITLNFDVMEDLSLYPIDSITPEYTFATPAAGMTVPSGASWTSAELTVGSTMRSVQFNTTATLQEDQMLFVRITTAHDKGTTTGSPYAVPVGGSYGTLKAPTISDVSTDTSNSSVSVTATTASEVPDAQTIVWYQPAGAPMRCLGAVKSDTATSFKVDALASTDVFGVQNIVGAITAGTTAAGNPDCTVSTSLASAITWGTVPASVPKDVAATATGSDSALITWSWSYASAVAAVISWAQTKDAWKSNEEPSSVTVSKLHAPEWNIIGLTSGVTWYFRVRFMTSDSSGGEWSEITDAATVNLSSAPTTPALTLSRTTITAGQTITAGWAYASGDGTSQAHAEVWEMSVTSDGVTPSALIASTGTDQEMILAPGWAEGTHYLSVRLTSASGMTSGWAPVVAVTVAPAASCTISATSLTSGYTVYDDDAKTESHTVTALEALPLTVTVTGAGNGGTTSLAIERAESFRGARPDESTLDGFEGETIYLASIHGAGTFTVTYDDLLGSLDDGAKYTLAATVTDDYGQTASAEVPFEVHWSHKAGVPGATVTADPSRLAVTITPTAPADAAEGDVCDIYRLSIDKPQLIYQGAAFGSSYVDPYPALGAEGGHRIVTRTASGCITADDVPAWYDTTADDADYLDDAAIIIDFDDGERVRIPYDISLDNTFDKDFESTQYLGGAVQGDWNPAVGRSLSIDADLILDAGDENVEKLRALAVYAGLCHIRTSDGSSFAGNVDVQEKRTQRSSKMAITLSITRVDPEGTEAVTLEEWQEAEGAE